jgi:serine/threonine protein kinase
VPAVATAGGLPTRLGKYEILTPLAAGGMARIYIARTTGIGSFERHVVLKLITPERANDTTAVQMFLDEARLAASLNHQNVAQVFEVGEDQGIHYLAMEYVHGQDLRALLAKAGSSGTRVPLELALTVVAGAAAGLHHAHERRGPDGVSLGIVHRDVSPSNIMIGYDGAVKLLDFGIAKATARSVETQSGIIKGKFAYMAPEQCRGREVDRRSDVFSLGIILYEISTQHRCFRADSDFDTMHRIVTGDVVRPTRLVQGYPQALEAIVMKALAVDANQRYQSSHQLLEAIESFAVSARMSLSTMALGRFMRDMFGDQPEPWLNQNRSHRESAMVVPRESTISNTNGTGSEIHRAPTNLPRDPEPAHIGAGATILDLPRPHGEEPHHDPPDAAEWNAKSYPTMQPSYASSATLPPDALAAQAGRAQGATMRQSSPGMPIARTLPLPAPPQPQLPPVPVPVGSQPIVPAGQFPPVPGSGSGPAHSAMSTRHAYASATHTNDLSYPRYEAPVETNELQLKPNRRPLFIGGALIVVGLAVILAMTIGNSGKKVKASADTAEPEPPAPTAPVTAPEVAPIAPDVAEEVKAVEPPPVEDTSIRIKITSDPPGADVLLAGKPIGTTPLDRKIEKGTGEALLRVHRGGYVDVDLPVDLTANVDETVALEKIEEEPKPVVVEKKDPPKPDPVPKKDPPEPRVKKEPRKDPPPRRDPPRDSPKKDPPKPSCQQPGQVDPFDTRPVCKS